MTDWIKSSDTLFPLVLPASGATIDGKSLEKFEKEMDLTIPNLFMDEATGKNKDEIIKRQGEKILQAIVTLESIVSRSNVDPFTDPLKADANLGLIEILARITLDNLK